MVFALISILWEYSGDLDNYHYILTAGPSGGVTYLKSDFFPEGGGYLQYGALIEGALSRTLVKRLTGKVGLSYQYLERSIPSDLVADELKWLADAFNEAPADQIVTPSVGLTVNAIPKRFDLDFSVARVHQVGSGVVDEFKSQTVVTALGSLTLGKFRGQLGYQTSFEIEDYTGYSVIASIRYLW